MNNTRKSGILLHITSLPSRYGIGDLGAAARDFADFMAAAGQTLWQILPTGPTGFADSPYQCLSAFAGNPLLIDLDALQQAGYLTAADLASPPTFPEQIDYDAVIAFKIPLIKKAAQAFLAAAPQKDKDRYDEFCLAHADWLDDFALFMALKNAHDGYAWNTWSRPFVRRDADVLRSFATAHRATIDNHRVQQFFFFEQWTALRTYCRELHIEMVGDVPIFVAHDSADVWAQPHLFKLTDDGKPLVVAGVPPDYFSVTGQLWGNPLYRWDTMAVNDYAWWQRRLEVTLQLNDYVRLDHYRGFFAAWEVPYGDATAINGKWIDGPGRSFFAVLKKRWPELPIIAENLGHLTGDIEQTRLDFNMPGMAILQFAFGTDPQAPSFRPHNYPANVVAYTGTHDNNTTLGWWNSLPPEGVSAAPGYRSERSFAKQYFNCDDEIHWAFIRGIQASHANIAIVPLQDVLGLGAEARMNVPAQTGGNWSWRYRAEQLNAELAERLHVMADIYQRAPSSQNAPLADG